MSVQTQISRITAAVGAAYDAVTAKGGTTPQAETVAGLADAIGTIPSGGSSAPVAPGDITFYDYDGTVVAAWSLAELAGKTALPELPSHEGLICQGWNWSLADLKTTNRKMNVGAMYITDDGKTRIYIRLEEGRTSPMLGVCPNGTVTVDWGDGTTPDTLTGTSTRTVKWTPTHAYAAPGDYVIELTVTGTMVPSGGAGAYLRCGLLRYSAEESPQNKVYQNSIQRIELGRDVVAAGPYAFSGCSSLASITIPNGIVAIETSAFSGCSSLASITIQNSAVTLKEYTFSNCSSLAPITIPNSIKYIEASAFSGCSSLASITIPNSIKYIPSYGFSDCSSLASITIPNSITQFFDNAFRYCYGIAFYDFTNHTSVPKLSATNAFTNIAADCEIRVPAALVDAWKTATNWSTYADHIVGV